MRCRFLHPGHWTITIPFSYARLVNVCEERWEQSGTVQVNVMANLGSVGSEGGSGSEGAVGGLGGGTFQFRRVLE